MDPLLTVAIPTWNRAALLERQLCWLSRALRGGAGDVEVLISDNASTDETPAVIDRLRPALRGCELVVRRHPENLGAIRNIASCLRDARGLFVWVVSDDDTIADDALEFVVGTLRRRPDLALLALDFSSRTPAGRVLFDRCFAVDDDAVAPNGEELFARCVARRAGPRWGGLALTTALVYRTDLARQALDALPEGLDNLVVQLHWTGFCAVRGPTLFTRRRYLVCRAGGHHFRSSPLSYLQLKSADAAEVFARLAVEGVAPRVMLRKLVERPGAFVGLLPSCTRLAPGLVARLLARYLRALVVTAWWVGTGRAGRPVRSVRSVRGDGPGSVPACQRSSTSQFPGSPSGPHSRSANRRMPPSQRSTSSALRRT